MTPKRISRLWPPDRKVVVTGVLCGIDEDHSERRGRHGAGVSVNYERIPHR